MRMTSCRPRLIKVAILEKTCEIVRNAQSIPPDIGKGPITPGDIETPMNDELSSSNSPSLNLS